MKNESQLKNPVEWNMKKSKIRQLVFTKWKFRFTTAEAEFCALHLFVSEYARFWHQG